MSELFITHWLSHEQSFSKIVERKRVSLMVQLGISVLIVRPKILPTIVNNSTVKCSIEEIRIAESLLS